MDLIEFDSIFDKDRFAPLKESNHLIDIDNIDGYLESLKGRESALPDGRYWKEKRVLVTGASGMVGSTIIDNLVELGAKPYGTIKRHAVMHHPNIEHHAESGKLDVFEVDLRDYGRIAAIIKKVQPHVIFHQAAESFVPTSLEQPSHVVENNCVSTVNVLEAAAKEGKEVDGVQVACSSEQYGLVKSMEELPVKETNELRPTSTYAATKVFTEFIAKSYHYMYKLPTVITRTFNQEGPRRGEQFFTGRMAAKIARCLDQGAKEIIMGNPNSVRDFTHIHDSSKAQMLAVEKCNRGEAYNICSGKGILIGDYAMLARRVFGLEGKVDIKINKKFLRSYERGEALMDGFIGDNTRIREKTGWSPTKSVVDIIKDSVESVRVKK